MVELDRHMRNLPQDKDGYNLYRDRNDYHMCIKVCLKVLSLQELPCLVAKKLRSIVFQQETIKNALHLKIVWDLLIFSCIYFDMLVEGINSSTCYFFFILGWKNIFWNDTWIYFYLCNELKHLVFLLMFIYFFTLYVWVWCGMCTWIPVPVVVSYVRCSGVGNTGNCDPSNMGAGNQILVH